MLDIKCYASGSTGNCYTLTNGEAVIMLDCGLPIAEIMKRTDYHLPDAVLVTHEHLDHAKAVADFAKRGIDVYATAGTFEALAFDYDCTRKHRLHTISYCDAFLVPGTYIYVCPFGTQHDAAEPCGFIVKDDDDCVLYATDTFFLRYKFDGLTKILIEANHSYEILHENVENGTLDARLAKRLSKSHFSIENVLDFLKANDLSKVKEIWLCHLSRDNADPIFFRRMVEEATGKPTFIAGDDL